MENVHFYFPLFEHFYIDIYILQIDLAALQLSIKTWNILNRIGIHTIGELINVLEKGQEELQIRMGKRCFSEMIYSLEELGLFCESDFDKENNDIG